MGEWCQPSGLVSAVRCEGWRKARKIQSQRKAIQVFSGVDGNFRGNRFEGGCDLREDGVPKWATFRSTVSSVHQGVSSLDRLHVLLGLDVNVSWGTSVCGCRWTRLYRVQLWESGELEQTWFCQSCHRRRCWVCSRVRVPSFCRWGVGRFYRCMRNFYTLEWIK